MSDGRLHEEPPISFTAGANHRYLPSRAPREARHHRPRCDRRLARPPGEARRDRNRARLVSRARRAGCGGAPGRDRRRAAPRGGRGTRGRAPGPGRATRRQPPAARRPRAAHRRGRAGHRRGLREAGDRRPGGRAADRAPLRRRPPAGGHARAWLRRRAGRPVQGCDRVHHGDPKRGGGGERGLALLGERARGASGAHRRRAARPPARADEPSAAGRGVAASALPRARRAARCDVRPRGTRRHAPCRFGAGALDRDLPHEPGRIASGTPLPRRAAGRARACARDRERPSRDRVAQARGAVAPAGRRVKVQGFVRPPGDKSISHRAVMLAGLARGASELEGLLTGADVKSTARVLRQLGARVSSVRGGGNVAVHAPRLSHPAHRPHRGHSGTTARLMLGILAGQRFAATLTGDASLRRRPMRRVTEPLRAMGADIQEKGGDALPLTIRGGRLHALTYTTPVASAQIKSALLLAGLTGHVGVTIREPYRSRDHTERLFVHLGLGLHERAGAIVYEPSDRSVVPPFRLSIPGDASSAAFLVAAAVLAEGGELVIEHVGVNPTRTGFLVVLERMGAHVERVNLRHEGGEPVADLVARPAALRGPEVSAAEVPTLVDEVPVLAVLASRAAAGSETVFREVGELRVKESNRLELIAANLRAVGVEAEARGNDLFVCGTTRRPSGRIETARDHRLAMAFAVLGTLPGADVRLSERASVAISYPRFFADLRHIGKGERGKGKR